MTINGMGNFSGNPKTEWLHDPTGGDRDMQLLEDFFYRDPSGRVWKAPVGSVINGASIPKLLWALVGSPYTGDYRNASVVHDVACHDNNVDRKEADEMFYYACIAGGCSKEQAQVLYWGVCLGAWANSLPDPQRLCEGDDPFITASPPTESEQALLSRFKTVAMKIHEQSGKLSFGDLRELVNEELKTK